MNWTRQQLIEFCKRRNISQDAYSFYEDKDNAFCLDQLGSEWLIYYSDRGIKSELAWAKDEGQAINILKLFLLEAHKLL